MKLPQILFKVKKHFQRFLSRLHDGLLPSLTLQDEDAQIKSLISRVPRPPVHLRHLKGPNAIDDYLSHTFCFLGSGWFHANLDEGVSVVFNRANRARVTYIESLISEPYACIDWQKDHKAGYRWSENTWYADIRFGQRSGVDVKMPWELSRMQHLTEMALAVSSGYAMDSPDIVRRTAEEFRNQCLDFIAHNPPRWGVNWFSAMDVAIRAVSWLVACDLFSARGFSFDAPFLRVFTASLMDHGRYIYRHLDWDSYFRGNHYFADLAGLIFIAAYQPESKKADEWLAHAVPRFLEEILQQFNPDGSNFEASTHYHVLVAEMALYTIALMMHLSPDRYERAGLDAVWLRDDIYERLRAVKTFLDHIIQPDGRLLQIGDNDSGRFIGRFPASADDPGGTHPRFRGLAAQYTALLALLESSCHAPHAFEKMLYTGLEKKSPEPLLSRGQSWQVFEDFGLYITTDDVFHLAVRCGPVGLHGVGAHAHNDQLSFALSAGGVPVLVDAGTGVYTADHALRNRYRSTAYHNTLSLPGMEQNPIPAGLKGVFFLPEKSMAEGHIEVDGAFSGSHWGYGEPHTRRIRWRDKKTLSVSDSLALPGPKFIHFHLDPRVGGLQKCARGCWRIQTPRFDLMLQTEDDCDSWQETYSYSPNYGVYQDAERLVFKTDLKKIEFLIRLEA